MDSFKKTLTLLLVVSFAASISAQAPLETSYSERAYTTDNGDYTAPRTDLLRSPLGDFIYGPNSKLEFKIIEDESGVKTTYYKIGTLPYTKSVNDKLLPVRLEDGGYRILYYSVDRSGNQEQLRFDDIFVDKTGPAILTAFSESPSSFNPQGLPTYASDTQLKIQVVDARVGIRAVIYQINDQEPVETDKTEVDLNEKLKDLRGTSIQIRLEAEDMLGNTSEEVISFKLK